jgi:hypothetical protein
VKVDSDGWEGKRIQGWKTVRNSRVAGFSRKSTGRVFVENKLSREKKALLWLLVLTTILRSRSRK